MSSRRSRKPGPIKEDAASTGKGFRNKFQSNWVSVNPVPGGALPTDVGDLTDDDIDNGVAGQWYYQDNQACFDIGGHGSDWVAADANGVEFYCNLTNLKEQEMDNNEMTSGKLATALMRPDGTGALGWNEMVGCTIEFLIESHENNPHDQNQSCGILVGVSNNKVLEIENDGWTYHIGAYYENDATTNPEEIAARHVNPQQETRMATATAARKTWSSFHFTQSDANNIICGYSTGCLLVGSDFQPINSICADFQKTAEEMDMTDKVYLVVAPFAYDNSGGGDAVRRTGKFKLWYRLFWSEEEFEPTYDPASNNRQGS